MGARPLPGGPRAPLQGREEGGGERRGPGPGAASREAPAPRPSGPGDAAAGKPAAPLKGAPARPGADKAQRGAPAAKGPAPVPSKSAAAPKAPARPAPLPLTVPLPRAGGSSDRNKPALTAKEALSARAKAANASKGKAPAAPRGEAEASARPVQTFEPEIQNAGEDTAREALQKAGDAAPQLIEAWLGASNAAAIIAVAEADEAPAAARKAARRALNVLRARGVAIPERSHVVRIDDRAEVSLEATLIPPDANGTMAIAITSRDAAGRYHIAEVIIREPLGIVQAGSGWLSGTQLKEGRNRTFEGLGLSPVPVPVDWARHRIAAARRQNADSRQIVPLGLDRCRELIEPAPETPPAYPLAHLEGEVTAERVALSVRASGTLHMEPEFRSWLPDRAPLDEMLQRVGERLGPEGVKDADRVNQAILEEMEAATDRFFSPEVRAMVERRLQDCAISVRARKGDARALDVLAVGRAVREAGLITSPPREIPFLVGFFQKALGVLAQQGGGQLRVPVSAGAMAEAAPAPVAGNEPDKTPEEEPPPVDP
jgi:hypothetical protein